MILFILTYWYAKIKCWEPLLLNIAISSFKSRNKGLFCLQKKLPKVYLFHILKTVKYVKIFTPLKIWAAAVPHLRVKLDRWYAKKKVFDVPRYRVRACLRAAHSKLSSHSVEFLPSHWSKWFFIIFVFFLFHFEILFLKKICDSFFRTKYSLIVQGQQSVYLLQNILICVFSESLFCYCDNWYIWDALWKKDVFFN